MQMNDKEQLPTYSLMNIFIRRGWYIVLCLLAVLVPIIYYNQTATPTYEAVTTIIYEEPRHVNMTGTSPQYDTFGKETLVNQIQEIQSRAIALEVVKSLPSKVLQQIPLPEEKPSDFEPKAFYAAVVRDNILAAPIAESDVIQIKARASDAYGAMVIANTITNVLKERNLRIRKDEVSGVRAFIEEQRDNYKEKLEESETRLRNFKERNRVTSLDKEVDEVLQRITHIDVLYQETKANREKTQESLVVIQDKINKQQKNLVPSISDISTQVVKQLKEQLAQLQDQYIRLQLQGIPENNTRMVQMRADMQRIRDNLAEEATKIAEADNVIDPLSQISNLYQQKITMELQLETYRTQERSLADAIKQYEGKLTNLPTKEYELARLTRDRELANNIYIMLSERREEARISEAEKVGNMRVIDKAEMPKKPVSPRKQLNLAIGLMLGLTMGLGLAFFLESLDTSLKTPDEVEKKTGLTIIGSIPRIRATKGSEKDDKETTRELGQPSNRLITYRRPSAPASEAYRTLRTNLQFSDVSDNVGTIMLTSSGPREGKSTTVANIAVTTAQMGLKTLVVDADLRRPTIHMIFGLHREPGLSDILQHFNNNGSPADVMTIVDGKVSEESDDTLDSKLPLKQASIRAKKTLQKIASLDVAISEAVQSTGIAKLDVLTCGTLPFNPSEVLASETMRDILTLTKEKYDFIFIDAPPIIAVTDAAVLAPHVDGVALVIESGRNDREIVLKAKGLLNRVGDNLVGAILNNVPEKNLYGDYNYYYTYYSERDQKSTKKTKKS